MEMRKVCASCQCARLLTDGQHYQRGKVKRWICKLCIERRNPSIYASKGKGREATSATKSD